MKEKKKIITRKGNWIKKSLKQRKYKKRAIIVENKNKKEKEEKFGSYSE
jgi:hypothetical protein